MVYIVDSTEGNPGKNELLRTKSSAKVTTSRLPREIARDEPAAGPGQTWTAQRLAATSNSFDKNAVTSVPFARAVVAVRNSRLDGHIEREELYVPVKEPTSWDCLCAHKRYRAALAYVAATFIGTFFL